MLLINTEGKRVPETFIPKLLQCQPVPYALL